MAMPAASVGDHVLVKYYDVGEELYHERLVLAPVAENIFIVASPDLDVFAEQGWSFPDRLRGRQGMISDRALRPLLPCGAR